MATKEEMVAAVKDHAMRNYENGWDTVVECYTDEEIAEKIGKARTTKGAIRKVAEGVGIYNRYAAEIRATAF